MHRHVCMYWEVDWLAKTCVDVFREGRVEPDC
jgi:hypothetical protein